MAYGKELILDLYECNPKKFNRDDIEQFLIELCKLIDMERCDLHFWDYVDFPEEKATAPPHLDGTTAVQFIKTSNITIHTLDKVGEVYINLFSCKDFDVRKAYRFVVQFFQTQMYNCDYKVIIRGEKSKCQNL